MNIHPDAFLTEGNVAALEAVGTTNGNLFVTDGAVAVELELRDQAGNGYAVVIPKFEDLAG